MSSPVRGPYAKTVETRRRIVEACVDAFAETGFYGATMKDIAQRAQISHSGLLHHFSSKESLLTAVLDARDQQTAAFLRSTDALTPEQDPLRALRGMLAVVVTSELRPGLMELHCVLSGEATSPEHPAHEHFVERSRIARRFYTQVFVALEAQDRLRVSIDPATLATMTIALINGLQEQWLLDRSSVSPETAVRDFLCSFVPELDKVTT